MLFSEVYPQCQSVISVHALREGDAPRLSIVRYARADRTERSAVVNNPVDAQGVMTTATVQKDGKDVIVPVALEPSASPAWKSIMRVVRLMPDPSLIDRAVVVGPRPAGEVPAAAVRFVGLTVGGAPVGLGVTDQAQACQAALGAARAACVAAGLVVYTAGDRRRLLVLGEDGVPDVQVTGPAAAYLRAWTLPEGWSIAPAS